MKCIPLFLLLMASLCPAETWSGKADLRFEGTSTLHGWGGKVTTQPFKADVTFNGDKPLRVVSNVTVKAAEMDTQEPKRDENMRKAMKVANHPLIIGNIDAKFSEISDASTPSRLPLTLNLLGMPQHTTGEISNWQLKNGQASFDIEFPVSMRASGISVPAVLFFIRVGDAVIVRGHVTLAKP
ncbi:MAG: YceI family protein [Prosthecobacter sp.]